MNCKLYAIDTKSIGVGPNKESALARVSIVDYYGQKVEDLFCRPSEPVGYHVPVVTSDIIYIKIMLTKWLIIFKNKKNNYHHVKI